VTTSTVFTLAGAFGNLTYMSGEFGGAITNGNTWVPIAYPNWGIGTISQLEQGAELFNAQATSTSGPKVAFGHSLGAVCLVYWLQNYGPTSSIPPSDLTFLLIGNSVNPYGGFCYDINWFPGVSLNGVSTPYTVTDFARQYDGWADFPQNLGNLLSDENALCGQNYVHPDYTTVSLTDPTNVSHTVGNITYTWAVTWPIPLLGTSQNAFTQAADEELRSSVESGYSRPVTIPNPTY
jgi:hypothetical protein